MANREGQISTQYFRKDHIVVTVLDVVNPAHFVVKESPTLKASSEAKSFLEAECAMQKYYGSLEPSFFPLPLKDSIIVVLYEKKFYRAKVIRILTQSAGHLFRVYLVDYGVECSVPRECTFEIERDFSRHPFQAVDVKLLGIEPISLVMNATDLSMSYGPVTYWDPSAEIFIHDLQKEMCSAYLEVKAIDEQYLHGSIFICYDDKTMKCVNDELISNAFAQYNNNCWEQVYKIDEVLENNSKKNSTKSESSTFGHVNPEQMSSSVPPSKIEPELKDLVTMFLSPDGKIISKSSLAKVDHSETRPKIKEDCLKLQMQEMHQTISPAVSKASSPNQKMQEIHQTISPAVSKAVSPNQKMQEIHQTISPAVSKAVSPNQKVQEIHQTILPAVSKAVSPNQKVQEIHQTISPTVSKALSPNQKALNLNRIQKLQMLNRKRLSGIQSPHSDTSDRSTSLVENQSVKDIASDVTGVTDNNSNQLNTTASEETIKIIPSCVDRNANSDNLISHSNAENNVVCTVLENKPRQECITEEDKIIARKKFEKLQMLTRKKIQSQVSKNTVNKDSTIIMKNTESEVNDIAISADKINTTTNSLNVVENEISQSGSEAANNMTNDYQAVGSSESPLQSQKLDELPERSLNTESKSQIIAKNLSTFQKLQQKVRNKKTKPSNSSQELTDDLKNGEKSSQMKACVESPTDCLNFSNAREISLPSAMSEAISSPEQKSPLLNQHRGVVDIKKIKALIDENKKLNQKAIQESNLIEDAIQISEPKAPNLSPLKQETLTTDIKIVANNTSSPIQQQKSSLLNRSVERTSAYSANEFECPMSVSDASSEKSQKSPLNNSKRSLEGSSLELPPMEPQQSEILNELLRMSDSDDPLCSILTKREERICDKSHIEENYILLSTQLKHSDPRLIDFNELSLWEKQKIPALLIGVGLTHPILNVEQAKFSKHIFQVLKDINFYGPSCIQSVIWPSIEKNRSMVAIAPPHAGKTVSYVLPLVSTFTEEAVPKSNDNGPSTIILCSSWLKAQAVYDLFYFFLRNKKMSIITLCTDGGHYKNRLVSLINSCDILIATPYCLLQFLKDNSIKFGELENFILDDSTSLMNKHKKELKNILLSYLYGTKRSKNSPQLMLFAERWNKNFHVILDKMMSNPLIYFTSFLESAVFAKISIFVHVCQPEQKKNKLLGIIKAAGKVVICTVSLQDAVDIHHFLRCEDVTTFLVNEEMEHYIADEVIKDWKSVKCTTTSHCLVITDQTLINMSISNAACLVHYDIPPESRLQFGNRFSCIAEHFQETNPTCVSHILMTESEHYYAPQINEIVENSGGTPPTDLIELCKKQNKVEDTSDLKDLCPYFKAFGFCKERQCNNRHVVDAEKDKPQVVPYEGDIQGLVTHIVDASHYYVRLLKYLDPVSNKTVSLISKYAEVGFLLRDYYSCAPAHLKVKSPVVGETYVLAEDNNLYYRIKVLKENSDPTTAQPSWKVLFLDEGWIKQYEKLELYELSNGVELPDPIAVEVYVCNITTPDSCFDWNPQTSQLVSDLIKGKEIHGKIALCLGKTLWLDPLVLVSQLSNTNQYINLFKLNQKLLECGHVRRNKNHLVSLHQACSGKVRLPNVAKPNIEEEKKVVDETPEIHYAFLECNTYEDVYVSSVVSPHQLYVQRAKFVECLDNLLDKINEQVKKRTLKKAYSLHNGFHCIAPFHEDDRYYRAVITDIVSYTEVHLFYVDFGDSAIVSRNNIYCLPAEFLLLPFQAIECELAGIAAAHGGWTDSSVDALMTLTRDEAGDMKILQLQAYRKSTCYDGGNHYVIDLWFNEKNLSEQLLQAGFGIPVDAPISQPPPPIKSQDISSELSSDEEFNLNERKISSDEEMDAEDKDTAALFYNYVAEMVLQANNLMPKPGATITEVSSDDEKCRNPSNETNKVACEKICKDLVQLLPKMNLGKNDGKQLEPLSTSHRPLIKWWDTPEQLNVLINLKDVKIYQLVVTDEGFSFNTIITGIQYSADEKLYDKIHSSDARKYQNCDGINIIVKKHIPFKWPRLTKEKKKFLHITYDLIHIEDSDSEEKSTNVQKLKIRPEYAAADNYSSSSTDEEEKYVEPWKDFAQQKSPFSAFD